MSGESNRRLPACQQLSPEILHPQPSDARVLELFRQYPLPLAAAAAAAETASAESASTTSSGNKAPAAYYRYAYGTAGFRCDWTKLSPVMVRVGAFAFIRSSELRHAVGVMVTASHNDESYNGVKLADPNGGMMTPDGEARIVEFVNWRNDDVEELARQVTQARETLRLHPTTAEGRGGGEKAEPILHVGSDTRSHSFELSQLLVEAARSAGCRVVLHGVVTTPQLHHAVLHDNAGPYLPDRYIPRSPNLAGYYDLLVTAYTSLLRTKQKQRKQQQQGRERRRRTLIVDCACGVGYPHVQHLASKLEEYCRREEGLSQDDEISAGVVQLVARNGPGQGPLNEGCGSEHVQKNVRPPTWYPGGDNRDDLDYCTSLDGDADRIVFFRQTSNRDISLMDGDKIACLLCAFLREQFHEIKQCRPGLLPEMRLGVVQTAYANGASTAYLRGLLAADGQEDNVLITKTGVKHLHAVAHDNLDVGIYFEANGHGTILFSKAFYRYLDAVEQHLLSSLSGNELAPARCAWERLRVLPRLVNQAVGDALSDMLLVDAILYLWEWDVDKWLHSMYTDLPSRQCKIRVRDRSVIETNDNETVCLRPAEVQIELDRAARRFDRARTFIRPSGTEDVVRVYAEAKTREQADALAAAAAGIVYRLCHGVGDEPEPARLSHL